MSRLRSILVVGAACAAFSGCDHPGSPEPLLPDQGPAFSEMPPEFDLLPDILSTSLDVGFDPNAYAIASMHYYGNRASINVALTAFQGSSFVGTDVRGGNPAHLLP